MFSHPQTHVRPYKQTGKHTHTHVRVYTPTHIHTRAQRNTHTPIHKCSQTSSALWCKIFGQHVICFYYISTSSGCLSFPFVSCILCHQVCRHLQWTLPSCSALGGYRSLLLSFFFLPFFLPSFILQYSCTLQCGFILPDLQI